MKAFAVLALLLTTGLALPQVPEPSTSEPPAAITPEFSTSQPPAITPDVTTSFPPAATPAFTDDGDDDGADDDGADDDGADDDVADFTTTAPNGIETPPPNGGYKWHKRRRHVKIHPNGNKYKCLDVRGAVFANGTPVQIYDCNGTNAQKWRIRRNSRTKVRLAGTDFCLDAGSWPANGVGMKIWKCYDNLPAQDWWYTWDKRISLTGKGLCLDLTNGNLANWNRVQTWQCTNWNQNQIWTTSRW